MRLLRRGSAAGVECRGAPVTGQTAKIASLCECGSMAVRQVNQFILHDELWWDSEFSCGPVAPTCANTLVRDQHLMMFGALCSQLTGPSGCGWSVRSPVSSQL